MQYTTPGSNSIWRAHREKLTGMRTSERSLTWTFTSGHSILKLGSEIQLQLG